MLYFKENNEIIQGVMLLVIIILGNYLGNILPKDMHNFLSSNKKIKNVIIFILIYFSISFSDTTHETIIHNLLLSAAVFLIFMMLLHMKTRQIFFVLIMFFIIHVLNKILLLLKQENDKVFKIVSDLDSKLFLFVIFLILINFVHIKIKTYF
jgi:hypothetical protein